MPDTLNRREFIKAGAASVLGASAAAAADVLGTRPALAETKRGKPIWANLLHLSYNMWMEWAPPGEKPDTLYQPFLRFDRKLWDDLTARMHAASMNMIVIDLGDGVKYRSHPEIAVQSAWTTDELQRELMRLRKLGLEPIPKMNFSTTHDTWLGKYRRMVSTDIYYQVCADLIAEVIELFDRPRFFHLGMDEETAAYQKGFQLLVVRGTDLWWHDLLYLAEQVDRGGSRAWIWSDVLWEHSEEFFKRMPKSIVQGNWYYGTDFGPKVRPAQAYLDLAKHGYDQIPTGSNWTDAKNFGLTVDFCTKSIPTDHLLGFLQTAWHPTLEHARAKHEQAIDQVAAVVKKSRA